MRMHRYNFLVNTVYESTVNFIELTHNDTYILRVAIIEQMIYCIAQIYWAVPGVFKYLDLTTSPSFDGFENWT